MRAAPLEGNRTQLGSDGYPAGFRAALEAVLGAEGLKTGAALASLDPGIHPRNLRAGLMARPATTAATAAVLALANRHGVGVVAQGGRTGLAGGAVTRAGQLIVSLDRMNRIESVSVRARTATVEAGVTLERLEEAVRAHGLGVGIDLGARGSATIGGLVSTNAGGIDAFRYGTMRERVLGLEVVLADGRVLGEMSRVRKDNAGLALRQLFIGAEGTLGVVTRAVLALVDARRPARAALVLVAELDAAIDLVRTLEALPGVSLAAAELMSGNHLALTARALGIANVAALAPAEYALLVAVATDADTAGEERFEDLLMQGLESGRLADAVLPKNDLEARDLWRMREDWAVDRARPGGLWYDVSVPVDALAGYLAAVRVRLRAHDPTLDLYTVGHLADGNVHLTVNAEAPITARYAAIAPLIYEDLKALGGSFSAEHGIGTEKVAALEAWVGASGIGLMRAVKAVFDPAGTLNPGKVLRARASAATQGAEEDPEASGH